MLQDYLNHLTNSIHSAQRIADVDLYRIAQQRMDALLDFLSQLPLSISEPVYEALEKQLPSDWSLWMESCRPLNDDCLDYDWIGLEKQSVLLH